MSQPPPIPYAQSLPRVPRGGLTFFGILTVAIGAFCACVILSLPASLRAPVPTTGPAADPAQRARAALVTLMIYAPTAIAAGWTGIACCMGKRWVRPLILTIAWPSLVIGVLSTAAWALMLPQAGDIMAASIARNTPPGAPKLPPFVITLIVAFTSLMMLLIGVVLPATYALYFRRRKVQAILETLDPQPAWTDAVPLPVLGLSIWLAIGAWLSTASLAYLVMPVFGVYVTGLPAAAVVLGIVASTAYAALQVYRQRLAGWWIATTLILLGSASFGATLALRGTDAYYHAMGMPPEQIEDMRRLSAAYTWVWAATPLLALAYLLYVRRFFDRRAARSAVAEN